MGDYGGPTGTMPLLANSPAIGKGAPSLPAFPTDQRDLPLASPPDIGAFQINPLRVNTPIDGTGSPSGDLSLRQAVNLANAEGGSQSITFNTSGTITLAGSQLRPGSDPKREPIHHGPGGPA